MPDYDGRIFNERIAFLALNVFFSVIDQNVFQMTIKNKVISVRMFENIG